MNARLQTDLDALESALSRLTESITTYNPSVSYAEAVLAADAALGKRIEELAEHQRNHARLQELRATALALETQLRSALGELADARADIHAAGRTARPPPKHYRPVSPQTLLDHAHNAAPFAAPVGFVPPSSSLSQQQQPPQTVEINGTSNANGTGDVPSSATAAAIDKEAPRNNPALAALEPGLRAWLDPITQIPFTPWPSNDMVARSGMARVQGWSGAIDAAALAAAAAEQGQGPPQTDIPESGSEAVKMEPERDGEDDRRAQEARARAQQHREEKPQVFMGMELLGSDEE